MWTSLSLWLPAMAGLAQAATNPGHLFVFPAETTQKSHVKQISPETARILIASRMGLDRYHDLGFPSSDTIELLNSFAPVNVFGADKSRAPVDVVLTYGDEALKILQDYVWSSKQELEISPAATTVMTETLFRSLDAQNQQVRLNEQESANDLHRIEEREVVQSLAKHLTSAHEGGYEVYVLHQPAAGYFSDANYGVYVHAEDARLHSRNEKRYNVEEPLELAPSVAESVAATMVAAAASSSTSTTSLAGILPACFSSLSACQSTTRNCTGHGECMLKYTDKDTNTRCYSCSCRADIRTNADGTKKTTQWGGPACQKKDVVAPFWLLAGFSVFMVFLVSWGIGTLWTMGDEQLPSVIGAGVSGPPRR